MSNVGLSFRIIAKQQMKIPHIIGPISTAIGAALPTTRPTRQIASAIQKYSGQRILQAWLTNWRELTRSVRNSIWLPSAPLISTPPVAPATRFVLPGGRPGSYQTAPFWQAVRRQRVRESQHRGQRPPAAVRP
jgi:hypothetical protein